MTESDKKAGKEIYRLAKRYRLGHEEFYRRCEYFGIVNGQSIRIAVFDRDPAADLQALRSAISVAEQSQAA